MLTQKEVEAYLKRLDRMPATPYDNIGAVATISAGYALGHSSEESIYYGAEMAEFNSDEEDELMLGYTPDPNRTLKAVFDPIINKQFS